MLNITDPESEFFRSKSLQPISREANTRYHRIISTISIDENALYEKITNGLDVTSNLILAGYFRYAVNLFTSKNYNVNRADDFGDTLSHIFFKADSGNINYIEEITKFLLLASTNFYAPNKMGVCGLDILQSRFHISLHGKNITHLDQKLFNTSVNGNTFFEIEESIALAKSFPKGNKDPGELHFQNTLDIVQSNRLLNFSDYLFCFVRTADYELVEDLLKFIAFYQDNLSSKNHNIVSNVRQYYGTLIHAVVKYRDGDPKLVYLLQSYGADINSPNRDGKVAAITNIPQMLLLEQIGIIKRRNWAKYSLVPQCTNQFSSQDR